MKPLPTFWIWGISLQSDKKHTRGTGQITTGIEVNNASEKVIEFILSCIDDFRDKFSSISPENGLTQELVYLLDNKENQIELIRIGISREHMEYTSKGNAPQDDIAIRAKDSVIISGISYQNNEPFMVFEAKRLNSTLGAHREKEYVVGRVCKDSEGNDKYLDSGGIERFKKEIHGEKLTYVGMLGYVQTDNFDEWLIKINNWIDEEIRASSSAELIWEDQDKLIHEKSETAYRTYSSKHNCISGKHLNIKHIWIDLL